MLTPGPYLSRNSKLQIVSRIHELVSVFDNLICLCLFICIFFTILLWYYIILYDIIIKIYFTFIIVISLLAVEKLLLGITVAKTTGVFRYKIVF